MKLRIDAARCTGHGRCYAVVSELFQPDELGNGVVRFEEVPPELESQALLGEQICPERAIQIERSQ